MKYINKATGKPASLAVTRQIGNALASSSNPLMQGFGKKTLRSLPPLQGGSASTPPSIAKTGTTNTPGVFLTTARQQRDINDINTTPRNVMNWKDIK
jgi:hypothetical protein